MTVNIQKNKLGFYNATLIPNQSNLLLEQACPITGIITMFLVPTVLHELNLEINYKSVFCELNACKKLGSLPRESLAEVNNDILAGAYLTVCKHLNLITFKDNPVAINAMLSTSDKSTLINALLFVLKIKQNKAELLPKIDLDYVTHKDGYKSFNPILIEHLKLWNDELVAINEVLNTRSTLSVKSIEYLNEPIVPNSIPRNTKSDYQRAFMVEFKDHRSKAQSAFKIVKPLLLDLQMNKLSKFLSDALVGENMLYVVAETKAKLIERLTDLLINVPLDFEVDIQAIITFIKNSNNEEINSDKTMDALERASDVMEKQKLTLKQILEAKKAGK